MSVLRTTSLRPVLKRSHLQIDSRSLVIDIHLQYFLQIFTSFDLITLAKISQTDEVCTMYLIAKIDVLVEDEHIG